MILNKRLEYYFLKQRRSKAERNIKAIIKLHIKFKRNRNAENDRLKKTQKLNKAKIKDIRNERFEYSLSKQCKTKVEEIKKKTENPT